MALALLILLSTLFAVSHLGMSHDPWRSRLIGKLGEKGFKLVYLLVSLLTLGGAIWVFSGHRGLGPVLWTLPGWLVPLFFLLMLLAFLLFVFSLVTPSPTGMRPAGLEARGVLRVTRHPMNMAFASFGLAHLLANGSLGDLFFFGSFFVVGFFGAYHQDRRLARSKGEPFASFQKQTGILPFAAILAGKTRLAPEEFCRVALAVALAIYLAVILLHRTLFGVVPF